MPLAYLSTTAGAKIPVAEVDPIRDCEALGASPATIAALLRSIQKRAPLANGYTASMSGKPARQLFLEEKHPYARSVAQLFAAEMAVTDHEFINRPGENIIANVRVFSRTHPWFSGELDNAALVEVRESDDGLTFVLDVYDLKRGGWYSAKLFAAEPFGKGHSDYAWQLNALAVLLEEQDSISVRKILPTQPPSPMGRTWRIEVRNLYIEAGPRDASYKQFPEAEKAGIRDPRLFLVSVPRKSRAEVYAHFESGRREQELARTIEYAPICENTWYSESRDAQKVYGGPTHLRCIEFCPVREECMQLARDRGEVHPLSSLTEKLQASLKAVGAEA